MGKMKKVFFMILCLITLIFISSCSSKNIDISIKNDVNLTLGDTYKIDYDINGDYKVSFSSSNENIVTVDETGLISSVNVGEAVVTLTVDKENIKKNVNVKVTAKETKNLEYGFYKIKEDVTDLSFIQGYPWLNTSVEGVINKIEKPSLKDDYFAYINYDKIKNLKIADSKKRNGGLFFEADAFVENRLRTLINDNSYLSNLRTKYYSGAIDEIKADINKVRSLNDIELKDYISSKELFNSGLGQVMISKEDDITKVDFLMDEDNLTILYLLSVVDSADLINDIILKMAEQEEIPNVDKTFVENTVNTYLNICNTISSSSRIDTKVGDLDQVFTGIYDIESSLNDLGYNDEEDISFNSGLISFFEGIENEGTEFIKNLLVITKIVDNFEFVGANKYLSTYREALKENGFVDDIITDKMSEEEFSYYYVKKNYPEILSKDYINRYINSEAKTKIDKLIGDVIEEYRNLLSDNTWLSYETKQKAIEKLNAMNHFTFYDEKIDNLEAFKSTSSNILDVTSEYMDYYYDIMRTTDINMYFFHSVPAYTVNACYFAEYNTFIICHGIVSKILEENRSIEFLYGSVGAVIGHEISHGFDSTGAKYDKDGSYSNWWTEEDKETFELMVEKIIKYYSLELRAFSNLPLNGDKMTGEIIADLGGIKVVTLLGEKIESFDFKAMYEAFATMFGFIYRENAALEAVEKDEHPLSYLRVNVTLSQQAKFREIYGLEETDGMYVPDEKSIKIW